MKSTPLVFFIYTVFTSLVFGRHQGQETAAHFTNEWVVRVEGGVNVASLLAAQMGYKLIGQVKGFNSTYIMTKEGYPQHRKRGDTSIAKYLAMDSRVQWAEQQFVKHRQKRDLNYNDIEYPLNSPGGKQRRFNDELWDQQWYLQDTRTSMDLPKLDLHVLPCYDLNITGSGIRVTILDDGIEHQHHDLRDNYDPEISYDVNDGDEDPRPQYDGSHRNAHGTRCAGEVAMKANNRKCGVGVAYNARIGGVRMLDGQVDDRVEGIALGFAHHLVDIYSASWGPNDDGQTVEGPGRLATEAIERGIKEGRGGKGAIFVWAGGNGGKGDDCSCDGYIGSIYTLAVGSASQHGDFPWYGEMCPATMATTYSSGAYPDQMIATTDLWNSCTVNHTGTSASAPLAAGIIALALEVNSDLTWRDVQHLVVWTSDHKPLAHNPGWRRNGAGLYINRRFGFGLMNAFRLVRLAASWSTVPEKHICAIKAEHRSLPLDERDDVFVVFEAENCPVEYLEHVELEVNIKHPIRGNLQVNLVSAQGTDVQLLGTREKDKSKQGFSGWKLMSVLTWGESPRGFWIARVSDQGDSRTSTGGTVGPMVLYLHGTKKPPGHLTGEQNDDDYNDLNNEVEEYGLEDFMDDLWRAKQKNYRRSFLHL